MKPWDLPDSVRRSLKQINDDSWMIADKLILQRTAFAPSSGSLWQTGSGLFFSVREVSSPLPSAGPLPADSPFQLIHDVACSSAVWNLGEAILKVKLIQERKRATKEVTTLNWLAEQNRFLAVSKVLYHLETSDRYYLIISRVHGETLGRLWPELDDGMRQEIARKVVDIIEKIGTWTSTSVSGIDGNCLAEYYLDPLGGVQHDHDLTPDALKRNCEHIGMDCSSLVFTHCDLGPYNIIFDRDAGSIGIIDWETAGFVPRAWVRTKARVSPGLDIDCDEEDDSDADLLHKKRTAWRALLDGVLAERGFEEVADAFMAWCKSLR